MAKTGAQKRFEKAANPFGQKVDRFGYPKKSTPKRAGKKAPKKAPPTSSS